MSDIQDAHDKMMQAYGGLAAGLVNGRDEVKAFWTRPAADQAVYQIMKWSGKPYTPAQKLRDDGQGLLDRVEPFVTALDSRSGTGAASDYARRILDCWRWGRSGDLKRCLPDISKPIEAATGQPTFVAARTALQSYNDTARPAQLNYWLQNAPNVSKRKNAACIEGGHLPSLDESRSMGLVAWHRVPLSFPGRTSFWLDVATPGCDGWPYSFRYHDATHAYLVGCANDKYDDVVTCVSSLGLFPATLPKLYPAGGF
ncbi:MAG: hypothetical protein E6J90_25660 [Deltaproteobacteria bacterium]|nr:MAG: hypothetical protein E6J90_25660 [Deltaproteobacteria bacterium]